MVTDTKIEILDKVYFEYNKATSSRRSRTRSSTRSPRPSRATPTSGWSRSRATPTSAATTPTTSTSPTGAPQSVKDYLVDTGVEADRLQSQGYGETQPIDRHHNQAAWAKNRRVEFLILKRSAGQN